MKVVKRDGREQTVLLDKITFRIKNLCSGLDPIVDPVKVSLKVCQGVHDMVTTASLDNLAAETAAHMSSTHPDYGILAARIAVTNLWKETKKSFSEVCYDLWNYVEPKTGLPAPLLSDSVYLFIKDNAETLNSNIVHSRDQDYNYFGFKTLASGYLLKLNGKIAERPQHMLMRVSCGLHSGNLEAVLETYNHMSQKWFTHATPTLFNAGTRNPQLSSCFLLNIKDDSISGIFDTLKDCASISKLAGGIGLAFHKIRASGAYIRGTNGNSNGIIPFLRVFNSTSRSVDQGGGKRKGSFAIYLEPWHGDVFAFLDLKKNHGVEENRARDLFYGLWVPDLFMKRVEQDGFWSLFCPSVAIGLPEVWGTEFEELYTGYEKAGKAMKTIKARELWQAILTSQIETGNPYILYKDACNAKSNQKNLGTIQCSNLCTEIIEFTSPEETAVCNLASISLPMFVDKKSQTFNHQKLFEITKIVTRNLNKVIDVTLYPTVEALNSNVRHRPIGIGVQGLADTFILLRLPFTSDPARRLNKDIFETIYFAALTASNELAQETTPYSSFKGSPASQGILQFDMWRVTPDSGNWNWTSLKEKIQRTGLRNSLLVAPMPTASTSQILGNNECFEPFTSNIYTRRTLAGEFPCVSKHLLDDLVKRGLWNEELRNTLIAHNGSVQRIPEIPQDLKELYKTVWELKQKDLIDMAIDRGAFIDQSQSFNVHMTDISVEKLTSMHFYSWKKGAKTGLYYLRSKSAVDPIKFTVDQESLKKSEARTCSLECESCSS